MRVAICNETFADLPLDAGFALARRIGYDGIEIAPFTLATDVRRISPEQRVETRRLAEGEGLEVVGLHWLLAKTEGLGFYLTTPDPLVRRATAEYLGELARLCRDLGGSLMVLGSPRQRNLLPDVSHDEAMDYACDVLRMAMPVCAEQRVTIAVEPLGPAEGDFLRTAELASDLIERVASPFCRLHLDVKAMSSEAKPIPEILRASRDALVHFHANDPNRLGPGMGDVDFRPILAALREIDYRGWISVEVFDLGPGPERIARESLDYLRRLWAEVAGRPA